jgi:uncharacterized membrane protein YhaH (DUF805 family)
MSTNDATPAGESEGWLSKLLTFRGNIGRPVFFLGLLAEFGILIVLVLALAAMNNPTGTGSGVVLLAAVFPFLALYLHLCLVTARLRDVGVRYPVILGVIVGVLPFAWFGITLEFVERLWFLVLIVFIVLYAGPGFLKSKASEPQQL